MVEILINFFLLMVEIFDVFLIVEVIFLMINVFLGFFSIVKSLDNGRKSS